MDIKVATRKINAFIEVWELEQVDREIRMIVYKEDIEALRVAKEALEKQIPTKIVTPFKKWESNTRCGACGSYVQIILNRNYCGKCGRKLDWGINHESM